MIPPGGDKSSRKWIPTTLQLHLSVSRKNDNSIALPPWTGIRSVGIDACGCLVSRMLLSFFQDTDRFIKIWRRQSGSCLLLAESVSVIGPVLSISWEFLLWGRCSSDVVQCQHPVLFLRDLSLARMWIVRLSNHRCDCPRLCSGRMVC